MTRPYGRFFYLPRFLAASDHEVTLILVSYNKGENSTMEQYGMVIHSISVLPNPVAALFRIFKFAKTFAPDWLIGFSDTYYGILVCLISNRLNARCLIDAYDNYEAYLPWCKPLHWAWRYALRRSDAVTCAGPSLQRLFNVYRSTKDAEILPMAVDPVGFRKLDPEKCRREFGLPQDRKLIGYFGGIHPNRGIDTLFRAVEHIRVTRPDVTVVMSGRVLKGIRIPEYVINLGYIPDEKIPALYSSVDCIAVLNRDSAFGNYSYPIKLYEAMACEVPVVVSRTESTQWIMKDHPELLVTPGNSVELAQSIITSIDGPRVKYPATGSWEDGAKILESMILNKPVPVA